MSELKSDLTYKGIVTLKLNILGRSIEISRHNAGTSYLMKIIAQFLSGNAPGSASLPQYVMLERQPSGETEYFPYLNSKQPITSPTYSKVGDNWQASFTAVINYSNMIAVVTPEDTGTFRLVMLSGNVPSDDIAYIEVSASDLSKISPGTNLIVDWKMIIMNDPSGED